MVRFHDNPEMYNNVAMLMKLDTVVSVRNKIIIMFILFFYFISYCYSMHYIYYLYTCISYRSKIS